MLRRRLPSLQAKADVQRLEALAEDMLEKKGDEVVAEGGGGGGEKMCGVSACLSGWSLERQHGESCLSL